MFFHKRPPISIDCPWTYPYYCNVFVVGKEEKYENTQQNFKNSVVFCDNYTALLRMHKTKSEGRKITGSDCEYWYQRKNRT